MFHCAGKSRLVPELRLAKPVERTRHAPTAAIEDVSVNHRGRNIRMTEQFLNGADVVARLQQMRGE